MNELTSKVNRIKISEEKKSPVQKNETKMKLAMPRRKAVRKKQVESYSDEHLTSSPSENETEDLNNNADPFLEEFKKILIEAKLYTKKQLMEIWEGIEDPIEKFAIAIGEVSKNTSQKKRDKLAETLLQLPVIRDQLASDSHDVTDCFSDDLVSALNSKAKYLTRKLNDWVYASHLSTTEYFKVKTSTKFKKKSGDIYDMSRNPRGYCIIINNYGFVSSDKPNTPKAKRPAKKPPSRQQMYCNAPHERGFGSVSTVDLGSDSSATESEEDNNVECDFVTGYRVGSLADANRLKIVFEQLGFVVRRYDNIKRDRMRNLFTDLAKDEALVDHQALVVIILTHGVNGAILGSDRKELKVESIYEKFNNENCKALIGKPKLFFVSACRGSEKDRGTTELFKPEVVRGEVPTWSDMFIFNATVSGYAACRNVKTGSWFGYELASNLMEYAHKEHLLDIVGMRVHRDVCVRIGHEVDGSVLRQSPEITLRGAHKKVYFNPGHYL